MKRIAIIGGGGSGLCAAKHMLSTRRLLPVVFEQSKHVGGTWVYEDVEEGEEPFSSIYKNLSTNLPKEVMLFPGFRFPANLPSFVHHSEVRKYLQRFAKHYELLNHIKFETRVTHVEPCGDNNDKWKVTTTEENGKKEECEAIFDGVVVCNGHYSVPLHPVVPGIDNFKGQYLHSHYYRTPDQFTVGNGQLARGNVQSPGGNGQLNGGKGQIDGGNVQLTGGNGQSPGENAALVLGYGPSAIDISIELATRFSNVYLSHRGTRLETEIPPNVHEIANLDRVDETGRFVCEDGFEFQVDLFLPSTGYKYVFPFLDKKVSSGFVTCRDRVVTRLFKHMFYMPKPTLCFIGIPFTIAPFPFIHQQCAYAASVYSGFKQLPSYDDMSEDSRREENDRHDAGESQRHFHRFGMKQFLYLDELARLSGAPPNPPYIKDLYDYVLDQRRISVMNYRKQGFDILDDNSFRIL